MHTWKAAGKGGPDRVIFGCLQDKAVAAMLRKIRKTATELWGVALPGTRGSDPLTWPRSPDRFFGSVAEAMQAEKENPRHTLVLGSLVLAGEVLRGRGVQVA